MPDTPNADTAPLIGSGQGLYRSFTSWGDALFELTDAMLCAAGPVSSIPSLSLEAEFTRSHGSLDMALAGGKVDAERLRGLLVEHQRADWPMVFAVDASDFERCDAECSPERGFYCSASRHSAGQPIVAGWHYQWICQLSWASDSWTATDGGTSASIRSRRCFQRDRASCESHRTARQGCRRATSEPPPH